MLPARLHRKTLFARDPKFRSFRVTMTIDRPILQLSFAQQFPSHSTDETRKNTAGSTPAGRSSRVNSRKIVLPSFGMIVTRKTTSFYIYESNKKAKVIEHDDLRSENRLVVCKTCYYQRKHSKRSTNIRLFLVVTASKIYIYVFHKMIFIKIYLREITLTLHEKMITIMLAQRRQFWVQGMPVLGSSSWQRRNSQ